MQAILPGKPQAQLQAACTGSWEGQLVITYISGTALVICNGPQSVLQTIYHEELSEEGLVAVSYHGGSGKIAVASTRAVYVYVLREEIKGDLRWSFHLSLPLSGIGDSIRTLSWGSDEELLVGSRKLTLYSTHLPSAPNTPDPSVRTKEESEQFIWSRHLSSPITHAAFSPSTTLIATISRHDRLVKIWRRLSMEPPSFDYTYLPHPTTVTHLEWRPAPDGSHCEEDVLYTICADGRLRVWKTGSPHNIEILSLHAELDLFAAVQPRNKTPGIVPRRYAFLIPSDTFARVADYAVNQSSNRAGQDKHAVEYLKELANRKPDLVFVMDNEGNMSAWGLENVACKRRNSIVGKADFFHAAHMEDSSLGFESGVPAHQDNARFSCFALPQDPEDIAILINHFDGRMQWWQGPIARLCDPSSRQQRMRLMANWTGHSSAIKKVIRTASGKALISRTERDEGIVWKQKLTKDGTMLVRKSIAKLDEHIHRTLLLRDGDFVVFLHHGSICLWDAREPVLKEISCCSYITQGKPIALLLLPVVDAADTLVHLATVTTELHGIVWELRLPLPAPLRNGHHQKVTEEISMKQFCTFEFKNIENLAYFLPVDPAGSPPVVSGFLDSFAQDIAISWTSSGLLHTWTAKVDLEKSSVEWLKLSEVETRIQDPSLGSGTSIRKAALVDKSRSTLTIWDTKSGLLDYEETFPNHLIQDLDWSSTPANQSILAVGFPHGVYVYTQLRYDYVNERPSWTRIKEISLRELSPHPIGDSVWLGRGNLVIGAGNQLFVVSDNINPRTELSPDLQSSAPHKTHNQIYDVVRSLNGPLPVFHPQFISQCVLAGKMNMVHRVLIALHKTLKFYTEGDAFDSLQGFAVEDFLSNEEATSNSTPGLHKSYSTLDMNTEPGSVDEGTAAALNSLLMEKSIPQLSSSEQFSLASVVECIGMVEKHRRSIDENAARFLLFWRASVIRSRRHPRGQPDENSPTSVTWREMVWAYHSSSHDILVETITGHHKGRLTWRHAKDTGMFMWLTDREALMAQFEVIARNAYASNDPKDPVDCSLYYLALRKKTVLLGLWRIATWSREQAATMRLLKNDFTDPRWKTAAAKNAYALMGKRRFEYAAALFLLGDDLKSAVSVLSNQLGDIQLAIAVARIYGGDDSPVLKDFLQTRLLPTASREGDRWQATWCYWLLGQRSLAVRALVNPLYSLLEPPGSPPDNSRARSFLNDDPALVVLYRQLREKSLQTLKGALMISGKEEWEFITKTASLMLRMGCDVLALDLVRNWEFLQQQQQPQQPPPRQPSQGDEGNESISDLPLHHKAASQYYDMDPRKLLRRRSSLVVADLPAATAIKNSSSLLDAWTMPHDQSSDSGMVASTRSILDDWGTVGDGEAQSKTSKSARIGQDATNDTAKVKQEPKPPPSEFKEPDPSSLLDSFGF